MSAPSASPAPAPERAVRLGVDVGDARVGLARSDLDGLIATPVETLPRESAIPGVLAVVQELEARAIMVGLPRSLSGGEGPAAQKARAFADELASALQEQRLDVEIRFIDERLTTVSAHQALHRSGRKGRAHRAVVDQVAAVMILQQALDAQRATGSPGGELHVPADAPDPEETER